MTLKNSVARKPAPGERMRYCHGGESIGVDATQQLASPYLG